MEESGQTALKVRPGTPDDAAALARLVNLAGDGLPYYLWSRMAEPGQDPWEIGRQRALREVGAFSYRNATVAVQHGKVAACLIGYPLPDIPPQTDPAEIPPMFVPLEQLEAMACGTWYINVLATEEEFRGRGIGSTLLAKADAIAAENGRRGTSLILSDANRRAHRLYLHHNFRERATLPIVKEDWVTEGKNWILMVREMRD